MRMAAALILLVVPGFAQVTSNTSHYAGGGRWDWTVFIQASPAILRQIQCVEYTLDPTFPNPVRRVCERGSDAQPFALSSNGWGEFQVLTSILYRDGKQQRLAPYRLALAPPAVTSPAPKRGLTCDTQINITVTEGSIRLVKGQKIFIYAGEIHASSQSRLYIVNPSVNVPREAEDLRARQGRLPEKEFFNLLRSTGLTQATKGSLDPGTYASLSLGPGKEAGLRLPSGELSLTIANLVEHEEMDVHLCLPR